MQYFDSRPQTTCPSAVRLSCGEKTHAVFCLWPRVADGCLNCLSSPSPALPRALELGLEPPAPKKVEETPMQKGVTLFLATVGLLGSYVTWGFMQEMVRSLLKS